MSKSFNNVLHAKIVLKTCLYNIYIHIYTYIYILYIYIIYIYIYILYIYIYNENIENKFPLKNFKALEQAVQE